MRQSINFYWLNDHYIFVPCHIPVNPFLFLFTEEKIRVKMGTEEGKRGEGR